jgi:WD40 repeat protein
MIILSLRGKIFTVAKDSLIKATGTYFYGMLSSGAWQPNSDGVYVIDRPSEGFERILDCLETGKLNCKGLTDYEIDCVCGNLDYFIIPFTRVLDYSVPHKIENLNLIVYLQLSDQRLCGRTKDNGIFIYNMDTDIIETTMKGHTRRINSIIQLEDGRICSCSNDETIKVWNIESNKCEMTIYGHGSDVTCVIQLTDGRLCSGSWDAIKIWNKKNKVCELSLDPRHVSCLAQLRNGRLCSGHHDGSIYIWNIATGECEMILKVHTYAVSAILIIDKRRICSCSWDKTIKIWNASNRTLEGHTKDVRDMVLLLDGRLCSVSYDGYMKIWNKDTGACDLSIRVSDCKLYKVVQLQDGRLVVSGYNRLVYVMG